jgi:hypothetical protein
MPPGFLLSEMTVVNCPELHKIQAMRMNIGIDLILHLAQHPSHFNSELSDQRC